MLGKVENNDKVITYERKVKEMARNNQRNYKEQRQTEQQTQNVNRMNEKAEEENNNQKPDDKSKYVSIFQNHIGELFVGILLLFIGWVMIDFKDEISEIKAQNASMDAKLEMLNGNYSLLNSQVWSINTSKLNDEESPEKKAKMLLASTGFSDAMTGYEMTSNDYPILDMEIFDNGEIIGTDANSNEGETKESLQNTTFIIKYQENGEDVFFYGKYNEYGQWDGECIINRYQGSNLTFIMEAVYDSGKLVKYRQVFRGTNDSRQEIWYVSDRQVEEEGNSGETITYYFYGDYKKDFDIENASSDNMMNVDKFLETIPSNVEGYYSGYTSDGRYNDDSGNAYMVKYDLEGNVRYLYKGRIKNGVADDDSGNAWELSWGYAEDGYHYHNGKFSGGEAIGTDKSWIYPVDQDFINSIVNPDDFNCPLTRLIK